MTNLEMSVITAAVRHFLVSLSQAEKSKDKIDFDAMRKAAVENCGLATGKPGYNYQITAVTLATKARLQELLASF